MTVLSEALDLWTIYERPRDYPQGFVVRRWRVGPAAVIDPDQVAQYAPDLLGARALVPLGKARIPGGALGPEDPCIAEVWL